LEKSRQGVLYEIDAGLAANRRVGSCSCTYKLERLEKCDNCIIRDALMISRSCVILGTQRIDVLKAKMAAGQEEVERALKMLMKKDGKINKKPW